MKKLIILTFLIAIGISSFAQSYTNKSKKSKFDETDMASRSADNVPCRTDTKYIKSTTTTLLSESFDTWPPADWTFVNTSPNKNWVQSSQYGNPTPSATVNWDDVVPPPAQDEWIITPTIVLPAQAITMKFDFNTSYYWLLEPNDNADLMVKITLDSGLTWTDAIWIEDNEEMCSAAFCWPWDNWEWKTAVLDLSSYSGQGIRIGFQYFGTDAADCSIDNIEVFETPDVNIYMKEVVPSFFYTNFGLITKIPLRQISEAIEDNNGIMFQGVATNIGATTQNVSVKIDVAKQNDTIFTSFGDTLNLLSMTLDTSKLIEPAFFPSEIGEYTSYHELVFDDTELVIEDNFGEIEFEITDSVFARDTDPASPTGAYTGTYISETANSGDGDAWCVRYYISVAGDPLDESTAAASVSVFVHEDTQEGSTIIAKIWDPETENWPTMLTSDEYVISATDIGRWIDIPFEFDAQSEYLRVGLINVGIETYGPDFYVGSDNSFSHIPQTAYIYLVSDGDWGYITDDLPMIRLNFGIPPETSSVADLQNQEFVLNQNTPNPCSGETEISFCISNSCDVNLSIFDIAGKKVKTFELGEKTGGKHRISIDLSNLQSGIYSYTLIAGDNKQTKKLLIK